MSSCYLQQFWGWHCSCYWIPIMLKSLNLFRKVHLLRIVNSNCRYRDGFVKFRLAINMSYCCFTQQRVLRCRTSSCLETQWVMSCKISFRSRIQWERYCNWQSSMKQYLSQYCIVRNCCWMPRGSKSNLRSWSMRNWDRIGIGSGCSRWGSSWSYILHGY